MKIKDSYCFLDMDGVLADFSTQIRNLINCDSEAIKNKHLENLTPDELKIKKKISQIVHNSDSFWNSMPKTIYADELLDICTSVFNKVYILSNYIPQKGLEHRYDIIIDLKKQWINDNLTAKNVEPIISKLPKHHFIRQEINQNILIDDMIKNINEWNLHGGYGILHKNFDDTKNKLLNLSFNKP